LSGSTPLGGNRLALLIARLLAQRSVSNPSQDDLGEHQQHCAPPFGRQRQPQGRTRLTGLAHGVTPATEPAPEALGDRFSVICQTLSNYERQPVWDIESGFRDTKDLRFGMGMASIRVSTPERRDRLWLLNAFAVVLLTLLGAAGEALGYDRHLKSNTSKKRTHSLFRQGAMLYELIPMMPEPRLRPLLQRFGAMLLEIPVFAGVYGAI
jgi:hypothetical protein